MDNPSRFMESTVPSINDRIAARVRTLRAQLGLSLDALAARTGVSRSALSLIERAESSPTAVVLNKLAAGLGVPLASLFDGADAGIPAGRLARRAEQPVWDDPGSGYQRRSVSPSGYPSPIQIVEVEFPAGAHVALEPGPRGRTVHQQVWLLEGAIELTVGDTCHTLEAGDCLAHELDEPICFRNVTREPARYAVVLVAEPVARR